MDLDSSPYFSTSKLHQAMNSSYQACMWLNEAVQRTGVFWFNPSHATKELQISIKSSLYNDVNFHLLARTAHLVTKGSAIIEQLYERNALTFSCVANCSAFIMATLQCR